MKRQRLWFWFSTNEIFPQWPASPVANAVILNFSMTLIFPEWTFLARILATALVCLGDGFLRGRIACAVAKPLLCSISERHSLLEFSFGAPYAQYSKSEIQRFFKRCLSARQCSIYMFPLSVHFSRYTAWRIDTVLYVRIHTVYMCTYLHIHTLFSTTLTGVKQNRL
jgi:hypothetical protein